MKVKDLIAQLQQLNPELEIVGHESCMERSFLVGTFAIGKIWKSLKRNRRQRCLAMEYLCEVAATFMRVKHDYDPVSECKAFYAHRAMWWSKWQNKWRALAEKYKEG